MNTAVLNAFVSAGAETYIGRLSERVRAMGLAGGRIAFMHALGGHTSAEEAMANPIHLVHSGPVGGIVAATQFAAELDESNIITADIGGTSFDTALVRGNQPAYAHRTTVNRLLTGLSSIDVHAIGAGGGSICWVDNRGVPQIGPRSAGADPGPACYGRGGREPALTDINLILGLIDPDKFWGGVLKLDVEAARTALTPVAEMLGRPLEDAAAGYHAIAITQMASAIEKVSLGRGYDPRDFVVVGYGGGSGLFLGEVCQELGITRLVMPRAAATFSAYGLLFADALHSASTTAQWVVGAHPVEPINTIYDELEKRAVSALREEGFGDEEIVVRREADLKFAGQSFEISMGWPARPIAEDQRESLETAFIEEYERVYGAGSAWDGFPVELHTARVVASGLTRKPPIARDSSAARTVVAEPVGERQIRVGDEMLTVGAYDGGALSYACVVSGPALIDDVDTTLLIPRGARVEIDRLRNYVFTIDRAARPAAGDGAMAAVSA